MGRPERVLDAIRVRGTSRGLPDRLLRRVETGSPLRAGIYRYVDWRDRRRARRLPFAAVPSADLRFRVHGDVDLDSFLEAGKQCRDDVRQALAGIGKDIDSFEDVLDFGCGCGRTLLWFTPWSNRVRFAGTDIDDDAIAWCRRELQFGRFTTNDAVPPLGHDDASFDLVYAISVFTHLTEDLQSRWLTELRRVVRPGGYVLATVRGEHYAEQLAAADVQILEGSGFVFSKMAEHMQGVFPAWYQTATQSEAYVRRTYAQHFEVLEYLSKAMDGSQDVVLLRRPQSGSGVHT